MGGQVTKTSKIIYKNLHEYTNVLTESFGDYIPFDRLVVHFSYFKLEESLWQMLFESIKRYSYLNM
jgi:hypothetical protein